MKCTQKTVAYCGKMGIPEYIEPISVENGDVMSPNLAREVSMFLPCFDVHNAKYGNQASDWTRLARDLRSSVCIALY